MVNNMPKAAQDSDLKQLFGSFGEVTRVVVVDGREAKFALVHMLRDAEALAAVEAINGCSMDHKSLHVEALFATLY